MLSIPPPAPADILDRVAAAFTRAAGAPPRSVVQIKHHNDVFRIEDGGAAVYFLKYYTKGWSGHGASTWVSVHREAAAWNTMRELGLGTPRILAADESIDNPLGQPHLITSCLTGRPLFDCVGTRDQPGDHDATVLRQLGCFLGTLHSQRYAHTGPLLPGYLQAPLKPDDYHFYSWSRQGMETWWRDTRAADATLLEAATLAARDAFVAAQIPRAVADMADPRLVHGDCHAHQFFCDPADGHAITGVIDLECAQSSEPGQDFAKLFIELIGHFAPRTDWLGAFWEGYGRLYDFDLLRLHLLLFQHGNFKCVGPRNWPGNHDAIVSRILRSADYVSLAKG
jgi:aminoglycoside phosphotransferase (APT) family kinase protein